MWSQVGNPVDGDNLYIVAGMLRAGTENVGLVVAQIETPRFEASQ